MTYTYKCDLCNNTVIITKPIDQASRVEHCEICESELKRVYEAPSITTSDGIKS